MPEHALFIPVHRRLPRSVLASALEEARIGAKALGAGIPVIVLDEARDRAIAEHNIALCRALRAERPAAALWFVPRERQRRIAADIAAGAGVDPALLIGERKAYGKMFNMMFIVGQLLGVDVYHRRDSDVRMQIVGGAPLAPIELELRYIGAEHGGSTIRIVGGNYVGEPNIRLDDCMKNDAFLRRYVTSWTTADPDARTEDVLMESMRADVPYTGDSVTIAPLSSPDYVDGGNVCFDRHVYSLFPSSPADELTGTDYCMFRVATALGLGVLVHTRRLAHDHAEEAIEPEDMARYWEQMFYNSDSVIYFEAFSAIERLAPELKESPAFAADLRAAFAGALRRSCRANEAGLRICLERLAAALRCTNQPMYQAIAERAMRSGHHGVFEAICRDAEAYIRLLERWGDIVAYLPELRRRAAGVLLDCRL